MFMVRNKAIQHNKELFFNDVVTTFEIFVKRNRSITSPPSKYAHAV